MTKRGPLSKIEKFYIENNCQKMTIDDISTDLDRAKSVVKAFAEKCKPKTNREETIISQQIYSNKRGSTVMTENGSMLSDDFIKSNRGNSARPNCTTQIR